MLLTRDASAPPPVRRRCRTSPGRTVVDDPARPSQQSSISRPRCTPSPTVGLHGRRGLAAEQAEAARGTGARPTAEMSIRRNDVTETRSRYDRHFVGVT